MENVYAVTSFVEVSRVAIVVCVEKREEQLPLCVVSACLSLFLCLSHSLKLLSSF